MMQSFRENASIPYLTNVASVWNDWALVYVWLDYKSVLEASGEKSKGSEKVNDPLIFPSISHLYGHTYYSAALLQ